MSSIKLTYFSCASLWWVLAEPAASVWFLLSQTINAKSSAKRSVTISAVLLKFLELFPWLESIIFPVRLPDIIRYIGQ